MLYISKIKFLVAYAEDKIDSIALRLKQQINENSKAFCWYNIIPELNHNELVGWKQHIMKLEVCLFVLHLKMYVTSIVLIFLNPYC
jgi:glucose-6-phosphate isomerase